EQTEKSSKAALSDLQRRLAAQEAEMRLLRGNQEVLQHENQSLKEQLKEKAVMESDMDRPMTTLPAEQNIAMPMQPAAGQPGAKAMPPGQAVPVTTTQPPPGTATPPGKGVPSTAPAAGMAANSAGQPAAQQMAMASKPSTPSASGAAAVAVGPPQQMYDAAYQLMRSSQFNASREGFEKFLDKYPDDTLSDNAQYWIGELNLVQKHYREALVAFGKVLTKWPTSPKVPPSLLKIGYAFDELGDLANARASLNKLVKDYPDSSAVPMARQRLQEIAQKEKDAGATSKPSAPAAVAPSKTETAKPPAEPPGSRRAKRLAGE
ncbi:tol-pal system protein YbgF, partial [Candidatus Magnetaquicoccus inordinatus]|uniref:tol-pal system protein YbgF n=1 Tax=Candidatus Magnetaquicoccus inordinatus TaxID=2496818 RepID=UPI00102BC2BE